MDTHVMKLDISIKDWCILWTTIGMILKVLGFINLTTAQIFIPVFAYLGIFVVSALILAIAQSLEHKE